MSREDKIKLEKRQEELLKEFDQIFVGQLSFPPYGLYMAMFVNFLIRKIMRFEDPNQAVEIKVKKGGETNDNPKEKQSEDQKE